MSSEANHLPPTPESLLRLIGNADMPLYATVDLASAQAQLPRLKDPAGNTSARCLMNEETTEGQRAALPWLVELKTDEQLAASWAIANEAPAITWISSPLGFEALHRALAARLAWATDDGASWLLRFCDPRILDELLTAMHADRRQLFLGVATRWLYLDRDLELCAVAPHDGGHQESARWIFAPDELDALTLASEAGQVLAQAMSHWPDDLLMHSGTKRFALAKAACRQAQGLRLESLADKTLLLMLAAAVGAGYFESPQWHADRKELLSRKATPASLLERLEDDRQGVVQR